MLCSKPIRRIPGFAYSTPGCQMTAKSSQNTSNWTLQNTPKCTYFTPKFPIITPKMTLFGDLVPGDTLLRTPKMTPNTPYFGLKWGGQHIGGEGHSGACQMTSWQKWSGRPKESRWFGTFGPQMTVFAILTPLRQPPKVAFSGHR